jgi:hypothetical protein
MLPFPSTPWSTTADPTDVARQANDYDRRRFRVAQAAADMADFRRYVARTAGHYRDRIRHYQIFNEPLYTRYALPAQNGYKMADYLNHLRVAAQAIREADEDAVVVGGIGAWASNKWVHEFVAGGGLELVDVMDLHCYPRTAWGLGVFQREMEDLARRMRQRGQAKPIWITEFGCYGEDDPYRIPYGPAGGPLQRATWPDECAAAEGMVKMTTIMFANGVRKVFFHAGVCGRLNWSNRSNCLFEYGGTPRKLYAALGPLAALLGADFQPVPLEPSERVAAYLFETPQGGAAVVWAAQEGDEVRATVPEGVRALDIMGNVVTAREITIGRTPVYLTGRALGAEILRALVDASAARGP